MPAIIEDERLTASGTGELPFPPVTKQHILHCSYHYWHPKYRAITPKARLIPLTRPFLEYLRADGIVLPSDEPEIASNDSGVLFNSDGVDTDDEDEEDVAAGWRDLHNEIKSTIDSLGGKVVPKLNWSAPKDATWMNANTMECRIPNDIYLLLKSSDFITHDLEHVFDDTVDSSECTNTPDSIPYHLVLRKAVTQWNPSVEFRCFVRRRRLLGLSQRDLNHYDFLFKMSGKLRSLVQEFFEVRLRDTFPDLSFVFDVYVPPPYDRVWLVDINPWAPRTDPLLFSWMELLTMPEPPKFESEDKTPEIIRLSLNTAPLENQTSQSGEPEQDSGENSETDDTDKSDSDAEEDIWLPELRLVRKTDPEAFGFSSPQYSAHKLPKDVVEAAQSGEGLRDFARDWRDILSRRQREDEETGNQSEDD